MKRESKKGREREREREMKHVREDRVLLGWKGSNPLNRTRLDVDSSVGGGGPRKLSKHGAKVGGFGRKGTQRALQGALPGQASGSSHEEPRNEGVVSGAVVQLMAAGGAAGKELEEAADGGLGGGVGVGSPMGRRRQVQAEPGDAAGAAEVDLPG